MGRLIPAANVPDSNSTPGSQYEIGKRFTVTSAVDMDAIAWYRINTSAAHKPSNLRLWEVLTGNTGELLATVPSVVDSQAVGWQVSPLATAFPLVTGKTYCVSASWPSGATWAWFSNNMGLVPDSPYVMAGAQRYQLDGTLAFPTGGDNNLTWSVTPVTDGSGGGGQGTPPTTPPTTENPPTNDTINSSLSYWLDDRTVNPNSSPKLGLDLLGAIKENGLEVLELVIALGEWRIAMIAGQPIEKLEASKAVLDAIWNKVPEGYLASLTDVQGAVTQIEAAVQEAVAGGPIERRSPQDIYPIPGTGWELVDVLTGTGASSWAQPADRYVLTITNPETLNARVVINGLPYHTHRGWWAPLNVDLVGAYRTLAGNKSELYETAARLPGVLFWLDPGIEWTLEAYDYAPASP